MVGFEKGSRMCHTQKRGKKLWSRNKGGIFLGWTWHLLQTESLRENFLWVGILHKIPRQGESGGRQVAWREESKGYEWKQIEVGVWVEGRQDPAALAPSPELNSNQTDGNFIQNCCALTKHSASHIGTISSVAFRQSAKNNSRSLN